MTVRLGWTSPNIFLILYVFFFFFNSVLASQRLFPRLAGPFPGFEDCLLRRPSVYRYIARLSERAVRLADDYSVDPLRSREVQSFDVSQMRFAYIVVKQQLLGFI